MGRNRNDSSGSSSNYTPIDSYRKQIGRQNSKNAREDIKRAKLSHQKKENAPETYKDALWMVLALAAMVFSVYVLLYAVLAK